MTVCEVCQKRPTSGKAGGRELCNKCFEKEMREA